MTPRRAAAAVLVALAAIAPASAAPKDARDTGPAVVLLAPAGAACEADDLAVGIEAAFAAAPAGEARPTLRREALPPAGKTNDVLAAWKKAPPAVVLAWAPDGRVREVEDLAAKAHLPTIVLSPEATRPSLDPARNVLWAGGARTPDEALQAMDFLLLPLGSKRPAILVDGSARAADTAAWCVRMHHVSQDPVAPAALPETFDAAAARALAASGADGILYFGGAAGAERLLHAAAEADLKLPILLGQGGASRAVPTFVEGKAKTAWALEAEWFEDYGRVPADDRRVLEDAAKAAGAHVVGATVRGWRTGRWVVDALRAAGGAEPKKLVPAFRGLVREAARGKPVFDECGWATLAHLGPWRSAATKDEPACVRVRSTLMPMQAMPQVGTFHPSLFKWQEGTLHVQCTWGEGAARTIERDLLALGLATGGYETEVETRILDDLMGRFLSRMSRLYLRNPDGSGVPGVSYRISFTTDPPPRQAKGVKWTAILAGDDPEAGGRASGSTANIFTTFIQRTMYVQHKLVPGISASDRPYLSGAYRWGTSVDENLRCDAVRSLVDGYSQALSLTGSHEVGHLCGLGHDTESPRSLMNVVEAVGLDFEWAEWIPGDAKTIEKRLGREPEARNR